MSIHNIKGDDLGSATGLYLRYEAESKAWSTVQLNCPQRCIRGIGLGYKSTRLEHIVKNLADSPELEIDASVLTKIHAAWERKFPAIASPLQNQIVELSPSAPAGPESEAKIKIKVFNTIISIQAGNLIAPGVECLLLPIVKLPNYRFINRSIFNELSRAVGRNLREELTNLWLQSPESASSLPSMTNVGGLAENGVTKILFPKRIFPPVLPGLDPLSEEGQKALDVAFVRKCLDLAREEGVRSFALCPRYFVRVGTVKHWTELDFVVMEHYIQEYPGAFDEIKLIYKSGNYTFDQELETAVSTCRTMAHPYGEVVD